MTTMATARFYEKVKDKSHEEMVEMTFQAMKTGRRLEEENEDLRRRLQQKTDEVERLTKMLEAKEAREQSYVKDIEFLTSRPLICTVNAD